ncbi:MAG: hypothetical protein ACKVPX_00865 [Myxococcaceae bacterium]
MHFLLQVVGAGVELGLKKIQEAEAGERAKASPKPETARPPSKALGRLPVSKQRQRHRA